MPAGETVQDALDRLLDPLDVSASQKIGQEDSDVPPGMHTRGPRVDIDAFLFRLKRSRRLPYKIPRLLAGWTALIVGVGGLIWITFSVVGLR
jgi:hypothetical protein